tara:strand:- start:1920 stop:2477 length:558 start_codon:yes stop_codon:yes gene_type:complete
MSIYIIITIVLVAFLFYWKNKPIKNSHKIPQKVEIIELDNPKFKVLQKGYKLILSRELGEFGFHLFMTIKTKGKDLTKLKKIIISWSEWKQRIFDFKYSSSDENVIIEGDEIRVDIGSFNNCEGSKNFLKRTAYSEIIKIDLLDYEPEYNAFDYENNLESQSVFISINSQKDLKKFRKGVHFTDS